MSQRTPSYNIRHQQEGDLAEHFKNYAGFLMNLYLPWSKRPFQGISDGQTEIACVRGGE